MDSVTHIFLGSALAMAAAGRRLGYRRAFVIGALAATFPDFDCFLHTGDEMRDLALHRHFMHSLIIVPLLAALSVLPFMLHKRSRPLWKPLYLAALIACVSHTLLDTLTSYGTMIFWPFTPHRYALDIIPVVDPLYTLPLIAGVIFAWKRKSPRIALAALLISSAYLGFATWQHARAAAAQQRLLAARGTTAENPRVLPQVGAVVAYRSIYIADGKIQADALRVPYIGRATFKAGGAMPVITPGGLDAPLSANASVAFQNFHDLADGFLARSPKDPLLIADERYTYVPEGMESVWGIQVEQIDTPRFRITPRWNYFGKLAGDLFCPQGYAAVPPRLAQ
jgi:inner membrane protein